MLKKKLRLLIGLVAVFILGMGIVFAYLCNQRLEERRVSALSNPGTQDIYDVDLTKDGYTDIKYIPNANYFRANPKHHENLTSDNPVGTCTTVAMQMLMGYHNYYSDRRLIPQKSVNGNDFLATDYGNFNNCPMFANREGTRFGHASFGTEDEVYEELFRHAKIAADPIFGQMPETIKSGAKSFIAQYAPVISANVSVSWDAVTSVNEVRAEIDAGRPVILVFTQLALAGSLHVVVAYGYATYNGVPGYIAHFGWEKKDTEVWVPATWVGIKMKMTVNHEHVLEDTGEDYIHGSKEQIHYFRELRCNECGYTTIDSLYETEEAGYDVYSASEKYSAIRIVKTNYKLEGEVTIPPYLSGNAVTEIGDGAFQGQEIVTLNLPNDVAGNILKIGNEAFRDCTELTQIIQMPTALKSIGANAFYGCSALTQFNVPRLVDSIGDGAFAGCYNLEFKVNSNNTTFLAENNILYKYVNVTQDGKIIQEKTEILHTGNISLSPEITVENTVTRIAPHAFDGNANLHTVTFHGTPEIGEAAFANCVNLYKLVMDSFTPPEVGRRVCSGSNMATLYVPYDAQEAYRIAFRIENVTSESATIFFDGEGISEPPQSVYYGQTLRNLPTPTLIGMDFNGWYADGELYQNGTIYMSKSNKTFVAATTPKQYTVTLHANGGTLTGLAVFPVRYGESFSTSTTANKEGNKLNGWKDENGTFYLDDSGQSFKRWEETENLDLYADWVKERYEVRIEDGNLCVWLDEALTFPDSQCTLEYDTHIDATKLIEKFKQSQQSFKYGYIFTDFYLPEFGLSWSKVPDFGEDGKIVTIEPTWQKEEYTLTFVTGTDECTVNSKSVVYDQAINLDTPHRTGYKFLRWEDEDGVIFNYVRVPDLTPDGQANTGLILFAQWEAYQYSLRFDLNGGTTAFQTKDLICTYDVEIQLLYTSFYRNGYDFMGWSTYSRGPVEYTYGQNVKNLSAEQNGYVVLYAVWQAKTFRIICENLVQGWTASEVKFTYGVGTNEMPIIYTGVTDGRRIVLDTFEGWYTSKYFSKQVTSISPWQDGDVTVYAKYYYNVGNTYASYENKVTDDKLNKQPYFEVDFYLSFYYEQIKNTTLKSIRIEVSMDIWEVDDGYQDFYLFSGDTQIWKQTIEHGKGKKNGTPARYTLDIPLFAIKDYASQDYFTLRFGAHGNFDDDWKFNNFEMHISFVNNSPTA